MLSSNSPGAASVALSRAVIKRRIAIGIPTIVVGLISLFAEWREWIDLVPSPATGSRSRLHGYLR
jgi:hypothetical protein